MAFRGGTPRYEVCPACATRPTCRICNGSGHAKVFDFVQKTQVIRPFGCSCMALEKAVKRLNDLRLPPRYLESGFETLEFAWLDEKAKRNLQGLVQVCEAFCHRVEEHWNDGLQGKSAPLEKPFLLLSGPVGSGKTHLAISTLKRLVKKTEMQGQFVEFSDLLSRLRAAYSKKASEQEVLGPLLNVDVLVVDELGKGRADNEWQLEKLDEVVNSRYNSRKVTLFTTNYLRTGERYDLKASGFADVPVNESFWVENLQSRIGDRLYNRIVGESYCLKFMGIPSYRLKDLLELRKDAQKDLR